MSGIVPAHSASGFNSISAGLKQAPGLSTGLGINITKFLVLPHSGHSKTLRKENQLSFMPEVIVAPTKDPSMADLRAMIAASSPREEAKHTTSEPVVTEPVKTEPVVTVIPEAATEPADQKTESAEEPGKEEPEKEEPLPEGVKKRIARETANQVRIQFEIDKAVGLRKAKEAELAKLKADASGSPPVKAAEASVEKPVEIPARPIFGEKGHENETWGQYETRVGAAQDAREQWLRDETKREALKEFETSQSVKSAQAARQAKWDAAIAEHGKDFPALMDVVVAHTSEPFQLAVSSMEGWSKLAVHLAKDPEGLKTLSAEFASNPYETMAKLGHIRNGLIKPAETKPAATTGKTLPEPLAKVGGNASVSGRTVQDTIENGSMSQLRDVIAKIPQRIR